MSFEDELPIDKIIAYSIGGVLLVVGLIFGIHTMYLSAQPGWNDMDAKGREHSYQVVKTERELLLKLASDYEKLEAQRIAARSAGDSESERTAVSQQRAIVDRMKIEASQLPPDQIPPSVLPFIR